LRDFSVSRQALYAISNEEAFVSAEMAVKIGKLCGNGPTLWLNLQRTYDLWHAQRRVDISGIPTLPYRRLNKPSQAIDCIDCNAIIC